MKEDLTERVTLVAIYIKSTCATVRQTANIFGVSKSTIHLDVTKRLKKINPALYKEVHLILQKNFKEKHLKGGEATRKKYLKNK